MEQATQDLEEEIAELERDSQGLLGELQTTIGDLSDLRYGRFSKTPGTSDGDLASEVMESLQRIQQLSQASSKG
jgi:centromere-localized protein 2